MKNNLPIVASRRDKYNSALYELNRFYSEPLDKAIAVLKELNWSSQKISNEIFDGEVSRQAIDLRMKKIGGEKS